MNDFTLDFSDTGSDGTTNYVNGTDTIEVSVSTPNSSGDAFYYQSSTNTLSSWSVTEPTSVFITFDQAVTNLNFEIYDVDQGSGWDDKVTIIALDALGAPVPVNFSDLIAHHQVNGNTVEAGGHDDPGIEGSGAPDTVSVSIPGSIVSLQIIHDNGNDVSVSGVVRVGPICFDLDTTVPCFTPDTMILTPTGEKRIAELSSGDKVITRDNGVQKIRWIGKKTLDWKRLSDSPHLRPIVISAGSLGDDLPERDLTLSPNHRILVSNDVTSMYFEDREVLASCKHLVNNHGISKADPMSVTYMHFIFDRHEIVLADGVWTESFQPGDYALKGIGNVQRKEIFEIFPELRSSKGRADYVAARKVLKKYEASLIVP